MRTNLSTSKFNFLMKKIIAVFVFGLAFHLSVVAQPTVTITDATANNGDDFCLAVNVRDFSFLLDMSFPITWDTSVIRYTGVTQTNPAVTNLGYPQSFDESNTDGGTLFFDWFTGDCSQTGTTAVTLVPNNEDQLLFDICFEAVGGYGDHSDVNIEAPIIVHRQFTPTPSCNNISAFINPGLVTIGARPLTIYASNEEVNTGDQVCVDFGVTGWENMTSVQFTVDYDETMLDFLEVQVGDIPNTSIIGSFATPGDSVVTVSWSYTVPGGEGITVADSTLFFTLCFDVIGDCEETTEIIFTNEPTDIEVINTVVLGVEIPFVGVPGSVTTNDCIPAGIQVVVDCPGPVELNDSFCVPIRAGSNFQNVTDLEFLITWNENILEYTGVQNINLTAMTMGNVIATNANAGILGIEWDNGPLPPVTVGNTGILFEVCFDVVGLGGNSPIIIPATPSVGRINNGSNIGVNPTNCVVEVTQPDGVTLTIPDANVPLGSTTCIDITASNFVDVESMQFSLNWDPDEIEFVEIQSVNLPGATVPGNFVTALAPAGALTFEWDAASPLTLNDGDVIMTICYTAVGMPNTCSEIEVTDFPLAGQVITSNSNGENIGIVGQIGDFCILNPDGFYLVLPQAEVGRCDSLCVPVKVGDFDDIVTANFDILFNPTLFEFYQLGTTFDIPGLTAANVNTSNANVGLISVTFNDPAGVTVPDSTIMFELCFIPNEDRAYECSPLRSNNSFVEVLTGDGSLVPVDGELCIQDQLKITNVIITEVSCPGDSDGTIEIEVEGGVGNLVFNWFSSPIQGGPRATNLPAGPISVLIFDFENPQVELMAEFEIPVGDAPQADIAQDTINASCNPPLTLVCGTCTGGGPNVTSSWRSQGGTIINQGEDCALLPGTGNFVFTCRDMDTGCATRDTVTLVPIDPPVADAGEDVLINCDSDLVTLDGSGSTTPNTTFLWTVISGDPVITPGEENSIMPTVTSVFGGQIQLRVTNTMNGCSATDVVAILSEGVPTANAGDDKTIGCDNTVTLDGSNSFNQFPVEYMWTDIDGNLIENNISTVVNMEGSYILVVTNTTTNCVARDTAEVTLDANFPVVALSRDTMFNCAVDTVMLGLDVTNAPNYDFEWSTTDGSFVMSTINSETPRITAAGTYEVTVTDIFSNCSVTESITVEIDTIAPIAIAAMQDTLLLNCSVEMATLDGTGSSAGDEFDYTWSNQFGDLPGESVEITDAGYVYLEVTNNDNACLSMDSVYIDTTYLSPGLSVLPPPFLSCSTDSVVLVALTEVNTDSITVVWTPVDNGNNIMDSDQLEASVLAAGTYNVMVTVNASGCSESVDVVVQQDDEVPVAIIDDGEFVLTCITEEVTLSGTNSSTGDRYVYEWVAMDGGFVPPAQINNPTITVEFAGTYQLTVTDTMFNCSAIAEMMVSEDMSEALVSIGADTALTCLYTEHTFNTSLTSQGANYSYAWYKGDDLDNPVSTMLDFMAQDSGKYTLVVTDTNTGCEAEDIAFITDLREDEPTVAFQNGPTLSCVVDETTVTAMVMPANDDYEYQWFIVNNGMPEMINGEDAATISLTSGGDYQVEVFNPISECGTTVDVSVVQDTVSPIAMVTLDGAAVDTVFRTCEVPEPTLSGSGSSGGPLFEYQWNRVLPNVEAGLSDVILYTPIVTGTFEFEVTNTFNGCVSRDTVVLDENYFVPEPTIMQPDTFFCSTTTLILDASGSALPPNYEALWFSLASGNVDPVPLDITGLTAEVDSAGGYQLTIIANPDIDECRISVMTTVPGSFEEPEIIVMEPDTFTCFNNMVTLDASQSTGNGTLIASWTTNDGGTIDTPDALQTAIDMPGTYILALTTNPLINACTAIDSFEVIVNAETPELIFEPIDTITCDNGAPIILDARPSGINEDLLESIQWQNDSGGGSPMDVGMGPLVVSVSDSGRYILSLSIASNFGDCSVTDTVTVIEDTTLPEILFEDAGELTCDVLEVSLDASGTMANGPLEFTWAGIDGNDDAFVDDIKDQPVVSVTAGGNFEVTVLNTENGCVATSVLPVEVNTTPPSPSVLEPNGLGCDMQPVALDASGSGDAGDFSQVVWEGVDVPDPTPSNALITEVGQAGTYMLTLTLASNGCDSTITVTVSEDMDAPIADATDGTIGCGGGTTAIDASGSSQGPEFSYEWSVLGGTATITDPTALSPEVDGEGTFVLLVSNNDNGCEATDTVMVTLEVDLPPVSLEADMGICEDSTMLFADIPSGATGMWRSENTGAFIEDPENGNTFVGDLQPGDNIFTFTLSAAGCENYSTDTIVITVAQAPTAVNDIVQLDEEQLLINFNVLSNDIIIGGGADARVLTDPTIGELESFDPETGAAVFTVKLGQFGDSEFTYELCSDICPELCDEGIVQIEIPEVDIVFDIPSGITMNEDGVNDAFVFDQLLLNPDLYPDNEMIIFNRWGDIVFQAKPYMNDFKGMSDDGEELPEGTYYYILRLNIARGEIIRGDVTIVK